MIDTILGILVTILCACGYGTIYFFVSIFWTIILTYIGSKFGLYNMVIKCDKSIQKEKTEE